LLGAASAGGKGQMLTAGAICIFQASSAAGYVVRGAIGLIAGAM
jgi:hypothetical protein